jgi:hypothetical protein
MPPVEAVKANVHNRGFLMWKTGDMENRGKTGDRQIIANIFLNGVEIVPSRYFKGVESSSGASRTIQPRRMKCDRRD